MQFFKKLFSKPLSITLTVTSSNGFHLRPVAKFVSVAKTFNCDIDAIFQGKSVSAKAVNVLLSLGLDKGDSFTLTSRGKDDKVALESLQKIFSVLMAEDREVAEIVKSSHSYTTKYLQGSSIYAGIAIAPIYQHSTKESYKKNNATFKGAVVESIGALAKLHQNNKQRHTGDIYLAQKELLLALTSDTKDIEAFSLLIEEEIKTLKGTKLESKSVDYQDLLRLVKSNLGYSYHSHFPTKPFILLAEDLLPSDITELENHPVQGVILKNTSLTSHTAILLRTSGIPSLILSEDFDTTSKIIILDTYASVLLIHPNKEDLQHAKEAQNLKKTEEALNYKKRFDTATTKDHTLINVYANITDIKSATLAKEEGAEGIGLLRTEFLFTEQSPSLEMQTNTYREIFTLFDDITVRTLDVGGDKALPYINLPKEDNPFLGVRGVRLFQSHPEIMAAQLHAIFLAASNKKIKIMFPMVSAVEEFNHAKNFAQDIAKQYSLNIENILFGIMIEVPSVLFALEDFDKVVDFYSIGTNDLSQYLFAIERTHKTLKIDPLSPVLFTVLENIVNTVTKPISICGELASHTEAIPKLVQMGYSTLSVTSKNIPQTKETIRYV